MGDTKLPSAGQTWIIELHDPERPQRSDAPFDEGARRRRRRWLVGVPLALVVSYVLALGIDTLITGTPSPPAPTAPPAAPLHVRTGATLVWALDSLHVINADTGASRTLPLPASESEGSANQMFVAHSLWLNDGGRTWLYSAGPIKRPVDLGASVRMIPAATGNGVWLWTPPLADQVRLVDFTGHQIGDAATLPTDWFPTGEAVDEGLVILPRLCPCVPEIWDPYTGKVVQRIPGGVSEIASSGHRFAWVGALCQARCILTVTDLQPAADGAIAVLENISLPPQVWPVPGSGALAPDGTTLAMSVRIGPFKPVVAGGRPIGLRSALTAVAVVDLVHRTARLVPGSEQTPPTSFDSFPLTWAANDWLFFADYGSPYVEAWRPGLGVAGVLAHVRLPRLPPPNIYGLPSMVAIATGHWVAKSPGVTISR